MREQQCSGCGRMIIWRTEAARPEKCPDCGKGVLSGTELRKIRELKEAVCDCDGTIRWLEEEMNKATNSDAVKRDARERLIQIAARGPLIYSLIEPMVRQQTKKLKHNEGLMAARQKSRAEKKKASRAGGVVLKAAK